MVDMRRNVNTSSGLGAALAVLALVAACGGDPGATAPAAPGTATDAPEFTALPLAACAHASADGLSPDKRSLIAMIAALGATRYQIHQVSAAELTIYTRFRNVHGVQVGWRIRFGGDGAGELGLPETMPPLSPGELRNVREWARGVVGAFDKLKCRPADDLRKRCERAGFSF